MARFNEDLEAPEIREDEQAELFLISHKSEEQIASGYGLGAFFKLFFGTLFAFAIPVGLAFPNHPDAGSAFRQHWPAGLAAAAIYGAVIAGYYLLQVYNGLVSVRERMEMAMSMIDVQLRRRHVLIPRLHAVVKAAADYESDTHIRVAEARTGSLEDQNASLKQLFALAEDYPDLKVNESFLRLQEELAGTETRIALAREFHNGTVRAYNDRIATLPDSLVAALARYRREDYFAAEGFERIVPKV
jgi:LemA protein